MTINLKNWSNCLQLITSTLLLTVLDADIQKHYNEKDEDEESYHQYVSTTGTFYTMLNAVK